MRNRVLFLALVAATFESLSIYWTPPADPGAGGCAVRFRKAGENAWRDALPLWFDARNGECRGCIVQLEPGTAYDVAVGGREISAHTWSERFPVARTITVGRSSSPTCRSRPSKRSPSAKAASAHGHRPRRLRSRSRAAAIAHRDRDGQGGARPRAPRRGAGRASGRHGAARLLPAPKGAGALERAAAAYARALRIDPQNERARAGLDALARNG